MELPCIFVLNGYCYNIFIDSCNIYNCRRQGISVQGGDNIHITNCNIENINGTAPQSGIDIETYEGYLPVLNVFIENNYFKDNVGHCIESWQDCRNINIINNVFSGTIGGSCIDIRTGKDIIIAKNINLGTRTFITAGVNSVVVENVKILDNISDSTASTFCYLVNTLNVEIVGNQHLKPIYGYAISVSIGKNCLNTKIINNIFQNGQFGIQIPPESSGASGIIIRNNKFYNNEYGFYTYVLVNDIEISNNEFIESKINAVYLNATNGRIINNYSKNISESHYQIVGLSSRISFKGNILINTLIPYTKDLLLISSTTEHCYITNNEFSSDVTTTKAIYHGSTTIILVVAYNIARISSTPFRLNDTDIDQYNLTL